jgi:hypothetical protein
MDIKMKLVEWLLVSSSLILGGMCLGVYFEAGLENGLLYALGLFIVSGAVLFRNRLPKKY